MEARPESRPNQLDHNPDQDHLNKLNKITNMVKHCISLSTIDTEALAVDIWLELWLDKDKKLCWMHVRNRTIDAIRKASIRATESLEKIKNLNDKQVTSEANYDILSTRDLINKLMNAAKLSGIEKTVIYQHHYLSRSIQEMHKALKPIDVEAVINSAIEKLRSAAYLMGEMK